MWCLLMTLIKIFTLDSLRKQQDHQQLLPLKQSSPVCKARYLNLVADLVFGRKSAQETLWNSLLHLITLERILTYQGTAQSRTDTSGYGTFPKLPCSTVPLFPSSRSPHYGLMLNLQPPAPVPQCCSPASHCPACPYMQGCSTPRCRTQHLSLLNCIWLSWSLCRASALEGIYSSSHSSSQQTYLVLLPVLTYYSFQSCIQVISEAVEENGAEDGTLQSPISGRTHWWCHPIDYNPLCLTLSQSLTCHMVCLPSWVLGILSRGRLWETVSRALLNLLHGFIGHWSGTDRPGVCMLIPLENWDNICQLPVDWDLSRVPRFRNHWEVLWWHKPALRVLLDESHQAP